MNVQQAIAQFLEHGQTVRNLSDRTLRAYQSDLAQFDVHLSDTPAVAVTPEHLEAYLDKLGDGPYRDTSIRRKVAALKVFFRYLEDSGVVNESPARRLKIRKPIENRVPTVLSSREVRALLAAPKEQIVELTAMRDHSAGARNRFFCAVRDNVILELLFKKHVRLAEIKRHVTPHALRHTMAAMLVSSGTDIREVQEILGHASILSTQVYTRLPIQKRRNMSSTSPNYGQLARLAPAAESVPRLAIKKK